MFTPININTNCVVNKVLLNTTPIITGNHRATPVKIPNTAPIDNT
jgi:hypothetical protein